MNSQVRIKCYIQEYLNTDNNLCARIKDKKTDKLVSIVGKNADKRHFLNFLSQIKMHKEIAPTIFEKGGSDCVNVTGIIEKEDENEIVVNIDVLCGGYLVE